MTRAEYIARTRWILRDLFSDPTSSHCGYDEDKMIGQLFPSDVSFDNRCYDRLKQVCDGYYYYQVDSYWANSHRSKQYTALNVINDLRTALFNIELDRVKQMYGMDHSSKSGE